MLIADQTGSGKTLSYLLPSLLAALLAPLPNHPPHQPASPRLLVLAPTAELAFQVSQVAATALRGRLRVVSAAAVAEDGRKSPARLQAQDLRRRGCGVLVGTPGRVAQLASGLAPAVSLASVQTIVLDEVDILLSDETFLPHLSPLLRRAPPRARFVFATATLPASIAALVEREFPSKSGVTAVRGPGLHRAPAALRTALVDVSTPPGSPAEDGLRRKADALAEAISENKCARTLVFCNTVETCRSVENMLARRDRGGKM